MNDSANDFADNLAVSILPSYTTGNFLVSPLSLMTALSMLMAGAAGATRKALASSLNIDAATSQDEIDSYFRKLLISYKKRSDKKNRLLMKNKMLVAQQSLEQAPLQRSFRRTLRRNYRSRIEAVDFQNSASEVKELVNTWIDKTTNGMIKNLLANDPASNTIFMLLNTIYFNFAWKEEFLDSGEDRFTTACGKKKKVRYMEHWDHYNYLEIPLVGSRHRVIKTVEIPYKNGSSMFLMLPPKGMQVNSFFEARLITRITQMVIEKGKSKFMELMIPKFKFNVDLSMKNCLESLGAGIIYKNKADFSGINSMKNLQVSDVRQAVAIDVDEYGTRAAAATIVDGVGSALPIPPLIPPPLLKFDRPFAFIIYDTVNGIPIFMGGVADPSPA